MHINDIDGAAKTNVRAAAQPGVRALALVVNNAPAVPQRRRLPRRRIVAGHAFERRRMDRRQARPGIDGLLRTVLADSWT